MVYESHAKFMREFFPYAILNISGVLVYSVAFYNESLRHCSIGRITMKPKA